MITVNIGLGNNEVNVYDYFLNHSGYKIKKHKLIIGEYNGEPELTLVLKLKTDYKRVSKIISDFEKICAVMTQECIAISSSQFNILVYNPNYTGKKVKFNNKYFISCE